MGTFRIARQPASAAEFGRAEWHGSLSALPDVASKACDVSARGWKPGALSAFLLYFSLSIFFFGRLIVVRDSNFHVAHGPDPSLLMWFLVWWPHAIAHGLSPMLTGAIWAPHVMNLAWLVSIPLASLVAVPLTFTLGPIAAFNTLCLLSLPLDAWYGFVLCRYLSRSYWAALLAGYIFGFSAFTMAHLFAGHLQLVLIFPIPLIVYFAARRIAGEISDLAFTLTIALLLVAEFLLSLELFATLTMFGGMVLALALSLGRGNLRASVLPLLKPIAWAYVLAITLVSPYLYYFLVNFMREAYFAAQYESTDFLNLLIPTTLNELGRIAQLASISKSFINGNLAENGACLSLPLIVVAILYAQRHWREPLGKLLIYSLIIIVTLSLGPVLHITGRTYQVAMPWWPAAHLPVLDNALPADFTIYAFLLLAIITSLWMVNGQVRFSHTGSQSREPCWSSICPICPPESGARRQIFRPSFAIRLARSI